MPKHLMFYDGQCGLCDRTVQFLLKADSSGLFAFAPLQGKTASSVLKNLPSKDQGLDSLVLVENYKATQPKFYLLGQGALRILWLLGGRWACIGWISFLPPILYNWIYRLIARYRHQLFPSSCLLPSYENDSRFLP